MMMADSGSDLVQLLSRARAGSREALGAALEACRPYLLTIAGQEIDPLLRAKGGASDIVQQTFLEAQRDFRQFDGTNEPQLLAWLRQVLLHNVANFSRAYRSTGKRDVARELPFGSERPSGDWREGLTGDPATPSGCVMEFERMRALETAIAALPDDYRRVIEYRYRQEHSFEEIGQLMNRSANAARKLWLRAVERLQRELE
jgi:RNA polymerase sigma-70 factor, ECF subfamily